GGQHLIVTPQECVDLVRNDGAVVLHPLVGGVDPGIGWESLELVANKVIPALN
ncbi:MAG TPA: LLM class flavin-dependent oxidoreductase, partial [Acidimicrobiaceae bacterium]|nr:LLM class flavin-dependent oxidoreductase [Acidimicrobiaceae bacterium]